MRAVTRGVRASAGCHLFHTPVPPRLAARSRAGLGLIRYMLLRSLTSGGYKQAEGECDNECFAAAGPADACDTAT